MSYSSSSSVRSRSTVIGGDDGGSVKQVHTYQVFRGMSPTTASRLEIRVKELEDGLEQEREGRLRAEKQLSELSFHVDGLNEQLDEADGLTSTQSEIVRRREQEFSKLKKDFELLNVQHESSEASLKKRHHDAVNDLTSQLEHANKAKAKVEKEKHQLLVEIESLSSLLDGANKAKAHAESKVDGLEELLHRLKTQVEELSRLNADFNNLKARLTHENAELQRNVQELDLSNAALSKARAQLQAQLDETKARLDEETRQRNQLTIQVTNLQVDFDNLSARYEEESEAANSLRGQLQRAITDFQQLKSRYDKDVIAKQEEIEDLKRRTAARVAELEDAAEQARSRAAKLEKEKNRLQVEIKDITIQLDTANANVAELSRNVKQLETLNGELQRRVDDLTSELQNANSDNQRLNAELTRLKVAVGELGERNDALTRENKHLSDALREAQDQNGDLSRQVRDLTTIRAQLQGERDSLASELADTRDAFKDAQARLDAANASLAQLRADFEHRLREKDDEIENIRRSSQHAVDELQRTIIEIEAKYKSELGRLRNKYETEVRELGIQIDALNRNNAELGNANKSLSTRVKDLELALDTESRAAAEAREAATLLDRKRISLLTELEDVRALLEAAERARKSSENELGDATSRISELTINVTSLTGDKRRLENDFATTNVHLDDALKGRSAAEARADRLQLEVNRLTDELRQEQESYKNADAARKQLEVHIREITVRLEEAENFAKREGKRLVAKLHDRLRDVEAELEAEKRRGRDLATENRKLQRLLQELRIQADEDHRLVIELTDKVNNLQLKLKVTRRQAEEAEEVVSITMNKYRKAQALVQEAERRADSAEKNITIFRGTSVGPGGRGTRSMSVTRELTRVVRV